MSCIPASYSMSTIINQGEPQLEEIPTQQRRGSRAYQIFPEPNPDSDSDTYPEGFQYRRERLPSIVVEPTDHSQLGSLEPPRGLMSSNVEEEEEEDSGVNHTKGSVDREQQEDTGMEARYSTRKCSIGPSPSLLSLSRLTPPSSPTPPEAAPPILRETSSMN